MNRCTRWCGDPRCVEEDCQARIDALEAALWLAHEHAKLHRSYDANQNVYEAVKAALENTTPRAPLENPVEATPTRVVPASIDAEMKNARKID